MNFTFYRREGGDLTAAPELRFEPCGPTEQHRAGFVSPTGDDRLLVGNTLALRVERKTVPPEAINREVARREKEAGRKFGRGERKTVAEQALFDLLPRAFPKAKTVPIVAWPDLIAVGSTTAADTDAVTSLLVSQFPGLALSYPDSAGLAERMTEWLRNPDSLPPGLYLGGKVNVARDCAEASFKAVGGLSARCEVQASLDAGHQACELALEFDEVASFSLTDGLNLKSFKLLGHADEDDEGGLYLQRESLRRVFDVVSANAA